MDGVERSSSALDQDSALTTNTEEQWDVHLINESGIFAPEAIPERRQPVFLGAKINIKIPRTQEN